jgi:hypothetical protein
MEFSVVPLLEVPLLAVPARDREPVVVLDSLVELLVFPMAEQ